MHRKGWTTAYRLAAETGISRPAAMRVLQADPVQRLDTELLETLATAFRVKPWALVIHEP